MRSRSALGAAVLLAAGLAASGCTMSTMGLARPLGSGVTQFHVAPSLLRIKRQGAPLVTPQLEVGGRYGVNDRVDLGARLWLPVPGYEVSAKIGLLRAPQWDRGLDLSVAPGAGYIYAPGGSSGTDASALQIASFFLPLLAGWNLPGGHQLVGSLKLVDVLAVGGGDYGDTANLVMAGGSLGFVWRISSGFALVPELSAGTLLAGSVSGLGAELGIGGLNVQAGVGFVFGGLGPPEPEARPVPPDCAPCRN